MHFILYVLAGFFFIVAVGMAPISIKSAALFGALAVFFVWSGKKHRRAKKKANTKGLSVSVAVELSARRLADIINESIKIAKESQVIETKLSRLWVAKEKLTELKKLASKHPNLEMVHLKQIELELQLLELKFAQEGFQQIAEGNMKGQELERAGKTEEAIAEYEKLLDESVDTPFTYRRLAIIYKKQKNKDKEIRVLKAAIENIPSTNTAHYQWFVERLAKLK